MSKGHFLGIIGCLIVISLAACNLPQAVSTQSQIVGVTAPAPQNLTRLTPIAPPVHINPPSISSQTVSSVTTISPNLSGGTTVACPAGTILTGGGYYGSNAPNLFVFYSAPLNDAWGAYAMNTSSSDQQVTAYAVCFTGPAGLSTQVVDVGGTVLPKGQSGGGGESATCPQGSLLTGGGFRNSYANSNDNIIVEVGINTPVSENGNWWVVQEVNDANISVLETTYAICLFGASSLFSSNIIDYVNIDNPGTSLVVSCPSSSVLTGGGFNVSNNPLNDVPPIMAIASLYEQ